MSEVDASIGNQFDDINAAANVFFKMIGIAHTRKIAISVRPAEERKAKTAPENSAAQCPE